ncbi:MAG: hypothetical protein V3S71_08395 [Acidobacteriota bacterium]
MPAIKIANQATAANAVTGLKFSKQAGPFLASLWASAVTVTDVIGFSVGSEDYLLAANPNLEATDIANFLVDRILDREPCQDGELFVPVTATTAVGFGLIIEQVL